MEVRFGERCYRRVGESWVRASYLGDNQKRELVGNWELAYKALPFKAVVNMDCRRDLDAGLDPQEKRDMQTILEFPEIETEQRAPLPDTEFHKHEFGPSGDYCYRIRTTGFSSGRLGNCEVCGKHATEVFIQVEQMHCIDPEGPFWTHAECESLTGHEMCLLGRQR